LTTVIIIIIIIGIVDIQMEAVTKSNEKQLKRKMIGTRNPETVQKSADVYKIIDDQTTRFPLVL